MAFIIRETKPANVHKKHKHFNTGVPWNTFFDYCPECGEYLLEAGEVTTEKCSCCNGTLPLHQFYGIRHDYCPNCGAKFEHD